MVKMTPQEEKVISMLAEAWNEYLKLPVEHPSDRCEFEAAIHAAQNIVAACPAWRVMKRGE